MTDGQTTAPAEGTASRPLWVKIAAALGALIALYFVGQLLLPYVGPFRDWVAGLGFWAPVVFIAGYVTATVLFVPGTLLTLAAGAIFGVAQGSVYVFVGATLGACAAFALGRTVAREAIEKRIEGNTKFAAIDRAVAAEGFKMVALLRLSPVFPFNLLNYALGLTRVRFRDFALASVGMIPATVLYVYIGYTGKEIASAATGTGGTDAAQLWLGAAGLLATLAVTWLVTRAARRALADLTEEDAVTTG